jgi:hypothetical protein
VTGGEFAAAMQRKAIVAMLRVAARVIDPVHITLSLLCVEKRGTIRRVNYWDIIADNLDSLNKARL